MKQIHKYVDLVFYKYVLVDKEGAELLWVQEECSIEDFTSIEHAEL